jgi:hypothetical protein
VSGEALGSVVRRELNIQGEITEQDYLRAQWLHMKPRKAYRVASYVVLALFAAAYALLLFESVSLGDAWAAATLLGPVAVIPLAGAFLRWLYQRIYRSQPSLQGTHSYQFTEAGFIAVSPHGRGEANWSVFTKWREDTNLFLLYQADNLFHMLPKRWFDPAEGLVEEFRGLLESRSIHRVD